MRPELQSARYSRRSAAIGLWSIAVVSTGVAAPDISFGLSLVLVVIVAVVSSAGLLLINTDSRTDRSRRRHEQIALAISLAIPIGWSILLGWNDSLLASAVICIFGTLPVIATSQLTFPRSDSLSNETISSPFQDALNVRPAAVDLTLETTNVLMPDQIEPSILPGDENDFLSLDEELRDRDLPMSSSVTQWMTRSLTDEGDIIEGGVRIEFAEGQRDITVHLSFCPPFREVPEIETEDLDGSDLEIRVAASYPFGARVTVRRTAKKSDQGISLRADAGRIGFVAVAHLIRRAA